MTAVASTSVMIREASPAEREHWDDLVQGFENHRVTHLRAWVESLVASGCGRALYLVFEKDGAVAACLPGLIATVGGLKLFGSPLEGWQTVSMGPVFDPSRIATGEIMDVLVPWLEREHKVVHIEMLNLGLDEGAMRASGFEGEPVWTYRAPLTGEAPTFKAMKDSARRNVKRAQRLGLITKIETDESFVDEHYAQLRDVYLRGGHVIPFSKRRVLACFRHLQAAGRLIAVSVYLPDGITSIATGMFFVEGRELSLWMWAHREHYRWYRPTELLTWTAMQIAIARGCDTFDFMGRGDFKAKFGAELDDTKWRWLRSRPKWLATARGVAGTGFRFQQTIRGRVGQAAARLRHNDEKAVTTPAVVLGDVDMVRALGLAGIPSVVVAPPGSASRFSRSTKDSLPWIDPWDRAEELVEALVAFGLSQPEPPVLFYQEDRSLLVVSRYRDRLRQAFRFVIPDAKLVEQLVDKQAFQQLAAKLGLPVPAARAVSPADEPMPDLSAFTFPVIVKPIMRRNDRWQEIVEAGKALQVDSAAALEALWPKLAAARATVLVQSLVPGPESAIESYHVYVGERGDVVAEFTGKKIRTYPAAYGDTTALEIVDLPDVAELGRSAVGKLGLRGVAKLDFKRAPDGTLFLFEVNPRFTLWNHPGACAGVNIPAIVYGDLIGRKRPAAARARSGVRWCKVWSDAPAARANGVSLSRWLPWMLGCEAKSAFAWDDPMPLVGAALWRWLGRGQHLPSSPDNSARLISTPVVAEVRLDH